jgi:putative transposase
VWVSPATVRRVLAANGLILRRPRRAGRSERRPFPDWASYEKHSIWIYDTERHEAFLNRAVMKGHRGRSVAAGR